MENKYLIPIIIVAFPFAFFALWTFVTWIISLMGWRALARVYKYDSPFPGEKVGIISARINLPSYNNCLVLHYDSYGMYLKTIVFFRMFHPPICIPWSEIREVRDTRLVFIPYKELRIGSPLVATIKLKAKTFERLTSTYQLNKSKFKSPLPNP